MERACQTCSDRISQKKTYSSDINKLRRKPAKEYYETLSSYEGVYEPKQNIIDF